MFDSIIGRINYLSDGVTNMTVMMGTYWCFTPPLLLREGSMKSLRKDNLIES